MKRLLFLFRGSGCQCRYKYRRSAFLCIQKVAEVECLARPGARTGPGRRAGELLRDAGEPKVTRSDLFWNEWARCCCIMIVQCLGSPFRTGSGKPWMWVEKAKCRSSGGRGRTAARSGSAGESADAKFNLNRSCHDGSKFKFKKMPV